MVVCRQRYSCLSHVIFRPQGRPEMMMQTYGGDATGAAKRDDLMKACVSCGLEYPVLYRPGHLRQRQQGVPSAGC